MIQLPGQPHVFRRPDLPAFDGLPMIDRAFCSALRVARTLGDDYATEGMDLEEVGLAHTMENLLYTICQETRTPVTFFLIFLAMDAPPFPISCYIPPLCTA